VPQVQTVILYITVMMAATAVEIYR